ncbi:glycosyltransferase [Aeromonas hydrophila]|uniref:glycosyltransferase n=1 Tax=Aeromonas hydrophila TaxID=644 RepID=UPI003D1A0C52
MLILLKPPRTESDIIKHWKYTDRVYVSIICPTFNQESYIENALDGFLSQITEYRFEIIVHDDASTDTTSSILHRYKNKYPSLINIITQTENQFSININMPFKHCLSISQGKYIALCEGDDFWCLNDKLQMQITELENNIDYNIVISSAFGLSSDGTYSSFCDLGKNRFIIPFKECILGPEKDFYPTASFLMRKDVLENLPDWFYSAPVGDYYLHVFCSFPNGCIYLPQKTVAYRIASIGSLSSMMNYDRFITLRTKSYECGFKLMDLYGYNYEFKKTILKKQARYLFEMLVYAVKMKDFSSALKYIKNAFLVNPLSFLHIALKYLKAKVLNFSVRKR